MTENPERIIEIEPTVTVHVNVYGIGIPGQVAMTVETSGLDDITRDEVIKILENALEGMRDPEATPSEFLRIYRRPR
jgi:hypothetical protein